MYCCTDFGLDYFFEFKLVYWNNEGFSLPVYIVHLLVHVAFSQFKVDTMNDIFTVLNRSFPRFLSSNLVKQNLLQLSFCIFFFFFLWNYVTFSTDNQLRSYVVSIQKRGWVNSGDFPQIEYVLSRWQFLLRP